VGLGAGGDVAPPLGGTTRLLERSHTVQPAQAVQMAHRTRTYRMAVVTEKVLRYFVCPIRRLETRFAVAAFSNQWDFKGGTTGTRLFDYGLVNFANGASYAPGIAGGYLGMTGTATDGSGPWVCAGVAVQKPGVFLPQ
jgi:hypothetical protein